MNYYAMRYKGSGEKFAIIDRDSGGYPCPVEKQSAFIFTDRSLGQWTDYVRSFPNLEIVQLDLSVRCITFANDR